MLSVECGISSWGWNIYKLVLDELLHEKERYKAISEELDSTFQELSGYWDSGICNMFLLRVLSALFNFHFLFLKL